LPFAPAPVGGALFALPLPGLASGGGGVLAAFVAIGVLASGLGYQGRTEFSMRSVGGQ